MDTIVTLALATFALGIVLGFVGAGGAGVLVAVLTAVFRVPIHEAIGTALGAMGFVTVAGAVSHYREGNVAPRIGLLVGVSGMVGAVVGADLGQSIPPAALKAGAGVALWTLAVLVWLRTRLPVQALAAARDSGSGARSGRQVAASIGLGLSGGATAAFFGVGMAPFLQLGLLTVLRLPLRQTVGTTMLTLVFISASGTLVLARHGHVSAPHLTGVVVGLSAGSFVGARFTRRAPHAVLRGAVVAVPAIAGAMLLFL